MYSASELYFTRTVRCFFEENKIRTVHFSEQCEGYTMLHCSLNSVAWCSRKKQVTPAFIFQSFKRIIWWDSWIVIYIFFVTKRCCICVLRKHRRNNVDKHSLSIGIQLGNFILIVRILLYCLLLVSLMF